MKFLVSLIHHTQIEIFQKIYLSKMKKMYYVDKYYFKFKKKNIDASRSACFDWQNFIRIGIKNEILLHILLFWLALFFKFLILTCLFKMISASLNYIKSFLKVYHCIFYFQFPRTGTMQARTRVYAARNADCSTNATGRSAPWIPPMIPLSCSSQWRRRETCRGRGTIWKHARRGNQ